MGKNKALIKSTGDILDIKTEYAKFTVNVKFGSDYSDEIKKIFDSSKLDLDLNLTDAIDYTIPSDQVKFSTWKPLINKYTLSDGNSYDESELVVGAENIRDSQIHSILQDGIQ